MLGRREDAHVDADLGDQHLGGALIDPGDRHQCVASDILGVSGRAMLDALVSGTTDPDMLADLARGQMPPLMRLSGSRADHRTWTVVSLAFWLLARARAAAVASSG